MADENVVQIRTPDGRFAPGTTGNPGGRIGLPAEVRVMLEKAVPQAVEKLVELIGSEDDRISLAASEALLSRLYGRPALAIDATVKDATIGDLHLQALQEIQDRRAARLRSAMTIEDKPSEE